MFSIVNFPNYLGKSVKIAVLEEATRGGLQLNVQFCVYDLSSNSMRQESCCEE